MLRTFFIVSGYCIGLMTRLALLAVAELSMLPGKALRGLVRAFTPKD